MTNCLYRTSRDVTGASGNPVGAPAPDQLFDKHRYVAKAATRLIVACLVLGLSCVAVVAEAADAIVIRSGQSARALTPDNVSQSLDTWTAVWLDLLTSAGLTADTASEAILEESTQGKLLILPNVSNLSDAQLAGLQRHLDSGYGVLMTWATATRDENDGWRGWDFLTEQVGGSIQTSTIPSGKAAALQMRGGVPGGCAIPPGYYLRFTPYVNPMYFVPGDSNAIGGYWATDGFKDTLFIASRRLVGMVVRQRPSAGRIVWLGANLDGLHVDSLNRVMAIKWARELFRWLNGEGIAEIQPWPSGNQCGVLIHGDIEDQFDKVQRITSVFRRLNVPSTYNILTNEAARHPSALEAILSTRAQLGIHGDNHAAFSGQSYELQLQRLNRAAGYIAIHGPRPTSFRPPELGYEATTLKAAKAAGITTFLADDLPDRDYPRLIPEGARNPGAGLVFFPKGELDDYDLFVKVAVQEPSKMADQMVHEFERIRDEGGLYKLNYHSQYLAIEHFPQTIETTIKRIQKYSGVWFATAEEISQWIRQREGLMLTNSSTSSTVAVSLRNNGLNPVKNAMLRILPPRDVPVELLEAKSISQNCEMSVVNGALLVKLPNLKPGANFSLEVGSRSGGSLSARNKHLLRMILNGGAIIGGVLILWLVFYFLFPKKSHYSQAPGPLPRNRDYHHKPIIDREYPVHSRPVKTVVETTSSLAVSKNGNIETALLSVANPVNEKAIPVAQAAPVPVRPVRIVSQEVALPLVERIVEAPSHQVPVVSPVLTPVQKQHQPVGIKFDEFVKSLDSELTSVPQPTTVPVMFQEPQPTKAEAPIEAPKVGAMKPSQAVVRAEKTDIMEERPARKGHLQRPLYVSAKSLPAEGENHRPIIVSAKTQASNEMMPIRPLSVNRKVVAEEKQIPQPQAQPESKTAPALIITAATAGEDTPELKPVVRQMRVAPSRRGTSEVGGGVHSPSAVAVAAPQRPVAELVTKVKPQVAVAPPAPVTHPAPVRVEPVPVQAKPEIAVLKSAKPTPSVPEIQPIKSVYFSPTGSRSTATLPARSPVKVESASDEVPAHLLSRSEDQPTEDILPGNGKFIRTSADVLKSRRPIPTKPPEGEWR